MITLAAIGVLVTTLAQGATATKHSYAAEGYPCFGMIVGRAGDVNGDSVPDIVLGDPGSPGEKIPPEFWIVSGKDCSVLRRITLVDAGDSFFVVDGGVDIDGDGVPDLLITAHPYGQSTTRCVSIYFVSGKTGSVLRRVADRGSWGSGDSVRFISDRDHDGIADAGVLNLNASAKTAVLSIYSGRSGGAVMEIPCENESGAAAGGFIELGDLDGDGARDFAVLVDGASGGYATVRAYSATKRTKLWEHRAPRMGNRANCRLVTLGDLDGDGVNDLAVSFTDCVEVILAKTGNVLYRLESKEPRPGFSMGYGHALAVLGDIDGDGLPDFAVSETEAGMFNGTVHAFSGKTGSEIWQTKTYGDDELSMFGYAMAALGDVNGDGVSDLIVGPWEGPSADPGLARVISGRDGSILCQLSRKGDDVIVTRRAVSEEKRR